MNGNPALIEHVLLTMDEATLYNAAIASPQMHNICINNPVLRQRYANEQRRQRQQQ